MISYSCFNLVSHNYLRARSREKNKVGHHHYVSHLAKMNLNIEKNKRTLILIYVGAFWKDTSKISANQTCPSVLFRNFDLKFFTLATWLFLEKFSVFLFWSIQKTAWWESKVERSWDSKLRVMSRESCHFPQFFTETVMILLGIRFFIFFLKWTFGQVNDFFTKINVCKFCTKYVKIGDLLFFWRFKVIFPKCG